MEKVKKSSNSEYYLFAWSHISSNSSDDVTFFMSALFRDSLLNIWGTLLNAVVHPDGMSFMYNYICFCFMYLNTAEHTFISVYRKQCFIMWPAGRFLRYNAATQRFEFRQPDMERHGSWINAVLAWQLIWHEGAAGKYKSLRRYAAGYSFPLCFLLPEISHNCIHFQQQKQFLVYLLWNALKTTTYWYRSWGRVFRFVISYTCFICNEATR
jgi:hypothetical protein